MSAFDNMQKKMRERWVADLEKRFNDEHNVYFFSLDEICYLTGICDTVLREFTQRSKIPYVLTGLAAKQYRKSSVLMIVEEIEKEFTSN